MTVRLPSVAIAAALVVGAPEARQAGQPAADAIRAAVVERLGADSEVDVTVTGVPAEARFTAARPDTLARLGRPMRFSLVIDGRRTQLVTAEVRVTALHAVATRDLGRGQVLTEGDVAAMRGDLMGVPIRPLPRAEALAGARALRPITAGAIVEAAFVTLPRAIEPGDVVQAVALAGPVEVTATMVAADGGRIGDVIRVVNPETKRYIRGRIVRKGVVEVIQ